MKGGGQKVRYVPRNPGNQTFLAGYPGILPGYPAKKAPEKFEKKRFVFNFRPLRNSTPREFAFGRTQNIPGQKLDNKSNFRSLRP